MYIVPPDAQRVGVSEVLRVCCRCCWTLRRTLTDFPEPDRFWLARSARGSFASLTRLRAQFPPRSSCCHPWPWAPVGRCGCFCAARPPKAHARGVFPRIRVRVGDGRGLHFPSGTPVLHLPVSALGSQSYLQADLDPISCPPFPSSLPRRKMVPQDWRVMVVGVTCFLRFFFLFSIFLK